MIVKEHFCSFLRASSFSGHNGKRVSGSAHTVPDGTLRKEEFWTELHATESKNKHIEFTRSGDLWFKFTCEIYKNYTGLNMIF